MNENINLCEILKDCPKGTKLWSPVWGDITFEMIDAFDGLVYVLKHKGVHIILNNGKFDADGECIIFPSKDQRDWNKFTAPWLKKEKFDPKTLQPFDKVLVRIFKTAKWRCEHFSYFTEGYDHPYMASTAYPYCVPYNDDTKHLVGTTEEAPKYYRYWED